MISNSRASRAYKLCRLQGVVSSIVTKDFIKQRNAPHAFSGSTKTSRKKVCNARACGKQLEPRCTFPQVRKCRRRTGGIAVRCGAVLCITLRRVKSCGHKCDTTTIRGYEEDTTKNSHANFLSRVSTLTRDIDIAILSVRLSVRRSVMFRYQMKTA